MGSDRILDLCQSSWEFKIQEGVTEVQRFTLEQWVLLSWGNETLNVDLVHHQLKSQMKFYNLNFKPKSQKLIIYLKLYNLQFTLIQSKLNQEQFVIQFVHTVLIILRNLFSQAIYRLKEYFLNLKFKQRTNNRTIQMNKLECPICHKSFAQPHMCPHCSQVYCLHCIRTYLNHNYFCPSCDHHIIELINCSRLIDEVKEKIKESDLKKSKESLVFVDQLCSEHSLQLKYHCLSCGIDICSDCGLISQKHKGHNIKPIESMRPPKNMLTGSQLKQIKVKVSQKLSFFQQEQKRYMLQLQLLKSQIKQNKSKIYQYYQQLLLRLQKQTQCLLKQIEGKIYECTSHISQRVSIKKKLEDMQKKPISSMQFLSHSIRQQRDSMQSSMIEITDVELYKYLLQNNYLPSKEKSSNRVKNSTRINKSFLKKEHDIQQLQEQRIHEDQQQSLQFSQHLPLIFDKNIYELGIMKEIYPEYENFSLQLDYMVSQDEDVIQSPNFKVYGYEWKLKIYPRGNTQVFGQYLSVFLQLVNSPQALTTNSSKQYYFRLQLLNLNHAGKSVIKQYKSRFSVGQCWGYAQFTPLSQVKQYLHDGKLLFVMGVKNVSYYDQCESMRKYIGKLEGEMKVLQQLCESYYGGNGGLGNPLEVGDKSDSSADDQMLVIFPRNIGNHHLLNEDEISSIISSVDED